MKPLGPRLAAATALATLIGACAKDGADVEPILDGAPSAAFQSDLPACHTLARDQHQLDREIGGAALIGAGMGGLLGGADDGDHALGGAAVGALVGAVAGASEASDRREAIVKDCLRGRGHRVVG